jgi:hypothetical protein
MASDIGERHNLATANKARRNDLLDDLLAWLKATDAPLPDREESFLPFTYVAPELPPPPPPPAQPVAPTVTAVSPTSGSTAGGTIVSLRGTGFASGATVTFGTSAASNVSVASATSITATTPARAAGAVNVVVTNPDGLSGGLTAGFTFVTPPPPPPPVITITTAGVSPSNLSITLGMRVRFLNNDTVTRSMNSDPHPTHEQCQEINQVGLLAPGESRETNAFNTRKTCGYHDHIDPSNAKVFGTIVVR